MRPIDEENLLKRLVIAGRSVSFLNDELVRREKLCHKSVNGCQLVA